MNDKDKLVSEILEELEGEGASKESIPLYEQIIRAITKFDRASVPSEVSEKLRLRLRRKSQTISIFKVFTKSAVAAVVLAFLVSIAIFNFPMGEVKANKVFIAAEDKPIFKDFSGTEFIAEKDTKITWNDDLFNLEKGEVIIYSYNSIDDLNFVMQQMSVSVKPNSVAVLQNCGNFTQVAVLKGDAEVNVGGKSQNMNANGRQQLLYQEQENFDQPIQGSPEKYAKIKNEALLRANAGGGLNSQNWANSNIERNVTIDRLIMNAQKGKTYLVKRIEVAKDSKECIVVFNVNDKEKKYQIKKGMNLGSWVVKDMTAQGFILTNGSEDLTFNYVN